MEAFTDIYINKKIENIQVQDMSWMSKYGRTLIIFKATHLYNEHWLKAEYQKNGRSTNSTFDYNLKTIRASVC